MDSSTIILIIINALIGIVMMFLNNKVKASADEKGELNARVSALESRVSSLEVRHDSIKELFNTKFDSLKEDLEYIKRHIANK